MWYFASRATMSLESSFAKSKLSLVSSAHSRTRSSTWPVITSCRPSLPASLSQKKQDTLVGLSGLQSNTLAWGLIYYWNFMLFLNGSLQLMVIVTEHTVQVLCHIALLVTRAASIPCPLSFILSNLDCKVFGNFLNSLNLIRFSASDWYPFPTSFLFDFKREISDSTQHLFSLIAKEK